MSEYIYVLSNPAMPGYLKIGMTTAHPSIRANELSNATGVPEPFKLEHFVECDDAQQAEAHIHAQLDEHRPNPYREFFTIGLPHATQMLNAYASPARFYIRAPIIEIHYG